MKSNVEWDMIKNNREFALFLKAIVDETKIKIFEMLCPKETL